METIPMLFEHAENPYDWTQRESRTPSRAASLALTLALGLVLGSAATAVADRTLGATAREAAAAEREWPARPIPLAWRWAPSTVETKHMFMRRR
jgi:hypothetical protein